MSQDFLMATIFVLLPLLAAVIAWHRFKSYPPHVLTLPEQTETAEEWAKREARFVCKPSPPVNLGTE